MLNVDDVRIDLLVDDAYGHARQRRIGIAVLERGAGLESVVDAVDGYAGGRRFLPEAVPRDGSDRSHV